MISLLKTKYKKVAGICVPVSSDPDFKLMDKLGIQASKNAEAVRNAFCKGIQCGKTEFTMAAFKYFLSNEFYQHKYRHMWE